MRSKDVRDDLPDGFEPAAWPDPQATLRVQRAHPRLCEAGPCRNYHRVEIQMDVQDPAARVVNADLPSGTPGVIKDGTRTLYRAPTSYHTQTSHSCYPTAGIEFELGSLPIVRCNRWEPLGTNGKPMRPAAYLRTTEGRAYTAEVERWEEARKRELEEDAEVERLIAEAEADHDIIEGDIK